MSSPRLFQGVKQLLPHVVKSSNGAFVETECGRKFLDFTCGIGVTNLGHSHEGTTQAVIKAAPHLVHAQQNIMRHRPMMDLIDRLSALDLSQKASFDSWFFWNSGSEAVEGAVKLARQVSIIRCCVVRLIFKYALVSIFCCFRQLGNRILL